MTQSPVHHTLVTLAVGRSAAI